MHRVSKHFSLAAVLLLPYFMACKNLDDNNPIVVAMLINAKQFSDKIIKSFKLFCHQIILSI